MSNENAAVMTVPQVPQVPYTPVIPGAVPFGAGVQLASLYVGELKPEVNEQHVWNLFSPHGQVMSVKVCRDSQTQGSLGYAYVNFRTHSEAEKAMEVCNFSLIEGKPCRIMWSMRDSTRRRFGIGNLFIKNIDPNLDAKSLYQAFSAFGPVSSCKIALDDYGLSKGYGFIQFYNEKDAEKARERSNGVKFSKKYLVVAKFLSKAERKDAKTVNPEEFTNIFIKNFGKDWSDEDLKRRFSKFGEITSAIIQKNDKNESLGYGFVNYARHEDAVRAINEMNDFELTEGNKITVCRAMKKLERQAYLRRQYEERKREIYKKFQNMNLYIKNFDENVTDEKLYEMFKEFGEIKSAHVMKDDLNRSRCFGFVCYHTAEEASRALESMNLKVIEGKPLYVSHAQSKEDRRKLFEQQSYNNTFRGPIIAPANGIPYMYPPPQTFAYPQNFPRYQQPNRQQNRNNNQQQSQTNQNYQPQNRYFNQNGGYNQNYRPRGNSNTARNQGNFKGNQNTQNQTTQIPNTQNPPQNVPQTTVDPPKKREEIKVAKIIAPDNREEFKLYIHKMATEIGSANNFETEMIPRVSGVVIDYYLDNSSVPDKSDTEAIYKCILGAFKSLINQKAEEKEKSAAAETKIVQQKSQ